MSDIPESYLALLEELALLTARGATKVLKASPKNEIEKLEVVSDNGSVDVISISRYSGSTKVAQIIIDHTPEPKAAVSGIRRIFSFSRDQSGDLLKVEEHQLESVE
jgi:hypothetical protein